jgi:hypothetical protein
MTENIELLIRDAFAEGDPPMENDIAGTDEYGLDIDVYAGKRWAEVSPILLDPEVYGLSERAFIYYLPAYLLARLRYDWFEVRPLLEALYPTEMPWDNMPAVFWRPPLERWARIVALLNATQRHAVKCWLEWLRECEPKAWIEPGKPWGDRITLMLANYWWQFELPDSCKRTEQPENAPGSTGME